MMKILKLLFAAGAAAMMTLSAQAAKTAKVVCEDKSYTSLATSFAAMFYNCKALEELDVSNFDTANATDLSQMFYKCELFESLDLVSFDTETSLPLIAT